MTLLGITTRGLGSIALLVAILWGTLLMERTTIRHAQMDTYRAMRKLEALKQRQHAEPAGGQHPSHGPLHAHPIAS